MRLHRATRSFALCLLAGFWPGIPAAPGLLAQEPSHAVLQIHLLDPAGTGATIRTDSYSLIDPLGGSVGDWAGRYGVYGRFIAGAFDPLIVVAYETIAATGIGHQSRFALLTYDGTRFVPRQFADVGPPGSEIHHVTIFPAGAFLKMHLYEGADPTLPVTVHAYTWDGDSFEEDLVPPPPALPPLPPDAPQPPPPPGEMLVGAGPVHPFAITTNSSVRGASRVPFIPVPSPDLLSVEADPKGGIFAATVPVFLTASSPSATIRFTLDGGDPDGASPVFSPLRPIYILPFDPLSGAPRPIVALKFQATEAGMAPSAVVSESYQVMQGKSADTDGDGLIDLWEVSECVVNCRLDDGDGGCIAAAGPDHCFDPASPDADVDCDRDGWSDFDEKRLGSDPSCGSSVPAGGADRRRVEFSGTGSLPGGGTVAAGSKVETISPRGSDLLVHAVIPATDPVTGPLGAFADVPTRGETDTILRIVDLAEPRIVVQRHVPFSVWASSLPPRTFPDAEFAGGAAWFTKYAMALEYDIEVNGQTVGVTASAMLQVLEQTVESLLPELVLDYTGIPIADVDRPPLGNFPATEDTDFDPDGPGPLLPDGLLKRYLLDIGQPGRGLTGRAADVLRHGTDLGLLGRTLLEAAENPDNPTYTDWVAFAGDVFEAIPTPLADGYFGTSDKALTDSLDGEPLDPDLLAAIDALPPNLRGPGPVMSHAPVFAEGAVATRGLSASARRGGYSPETLPADLPGLVAAVKAAATTTAAIYGRVVARGERGVYEAGDAHATGSFYRGLVADLVAERAGNIPALRDIEAGASAVTLAVAEARLLASGGRPSAVLRLRAGIGVIAAALDAADGGVTALQNLEGRMAELVYRIDLAAVSPAALAQLEASAGEFLLPDVVPPEVTALPAGPLFTGSVSVTLFSDEPATIFYTLDGTDPVPGAGNTQSGLNEVAGLVITSDTTLSYIGRDTPAMNQSVVRRITYRSDADADAIADVNDNCPADFNPGQANFDGDVQGDVCDPDDDNDTFADFGDCRPFDPTLWSAPGESPITLTFSGATTLQWTSLAVAAGQSTLYDLIKGPISDFRGGQPPGSEFDGAVCRLNDTASLTETDGDSPSLGQGFYYHVRGDNLCGMGSYGRRSNGVERVTLACP